MREQAKKEAAEKAAEVAKEKEKLPEGWGQKVTAEGRPFFIDYANERTTWRDPRKTLEWLEGDGSEEDDVGREKNFRLGDPIAVRGPVFRVRQMNVCCCHCCHAMDDEWCYLAQSHGCRGMLSPVRLM